jgi:hypothetical protein
MWHGACSTAANPAGQAGPTRSGGAHCAQRIGIFAYGIVAYDPSSSRPFSTAVGFVGDLGVPKAFDSLPRPSPPGRARDPTSAVAVFADLHSVMARPAFKRWWTGSFHRAASAARTFCSPARAGAIFWQWAPIRPCRLAAREPAYRIGIARAHFATGGPSFLVATFLINHFDLIRSPSVVVTCAARSIDRSTS